MTEEKRPKTYADSVAEIASKISAEAKTIRSLENCREEWTRPEGAYVNIGGNAYVVRKDGTVNPLLVGIQREALRALDDLLHHHRGRLEGLRFALVKLGREG